MAIGPALDALLDTLIRLDAPLARWLARGIDRAEIDARLGDLSLGLADEVYDYFAWRNGLRTTRDADYELFPGFAMLSFEEALADYRMLLATAARIAERAGVPATTLWNERWFPLFRDAGGDYHVTLSVPDGAPTAPIYMVVREDPESAHLTYDNLTSLILTVADCFRTGAFQTVDGILEEDRLRAASIVRARNPERMRRAAEWRP
jgi:cell wall assembly regulator SMI1